MIERRLLQLVLAVASLSPLVFGGLGVVFGPSWLKGAGEASADLESHFRYLSGIFFGVGLAVLSCLPRIETTTGRLRWIATLVVVGGLARLGGLLTQTVPSAGHVAAVGMELVVTPLLVLWQARIARKGRPDPAGAAARPSIETLPRR